MPRNSPQQVTWEFPQIFTPLYMALLPMKTWNCLLAKSQPGVTYECMRNSHQISGISAVCMRAACFESVPPGPVGGSAAAPLLWVLLKLLRHSV